MDKMDKKKDLEDFVECVPGLMSTNSSNIRDLRDSVKCLRYYEILWVSGSIFGGLMGKNARGPGKKSLLS
jgi:hypothetical protein